MKRFQQNRVIIPRSRLDVGSGGGGGGGGGTGMIAESYTKVTTAQQTFNPGNWGGTWTQNAVGDATDIIMEMQWAAAPNEVNTNCGFSSFDTGISFTSFAKARLMSIVMDFDSIAGIGPTGSANDNFLTGIYLSDRVLNVTDVPGVPGFRWGGAISRTTRPSYSFLYYYLRPFPAATLGGTTRVVAATVSSIGTYILMLPDGQTNFTFGNAQFDDGSGAANYGLGAQNPGAIPYNTNPAATMIIGCWFAERNKPVTPGTNYQMTYTLKYSVTDL